MLPVLLALLAVTGVGAGGFVLVGNASEATAECEGSETVRIAAAAEIAPVLGEATRDLEADGFGAGGACVDYELEIAAPEQVAETLSDPEKKPDLWAPDLSVWLSQAALSGSTPVTVSQSLAKSPVVVVGRDATPPASWREVGMNTVAYLDPLTSSASTAALLSAFGEMSVTGATEAEMGAMMVPLAQRYGAQPDKPTTVQDVAKAADAGALGVMTEQQLVSIQDAGQARRLTATTPKSGTMLLDYPLAVMSDEESTLKAGRRLAEYLASDDGAELLAVNGFRDPENTPLPSGGGLGKGKLEVLPTPGPDAVTGALQRWAVLTVPSRSLAVVDVSGSMDFKDAGRSRISLAIAAANGALKLFPDNSQIGMWAFSIDLGGRKRDHTSLLPIRSLGSVSRGTSHREKLAAALDELPQMTYGGTGLYDTSLAAIRAVRDDYRASAVNNVILLTDGENEDPGSLSLNELVSKIESEHDPDRPVSVIAIGMGPDADAKALERIAEATDGRSYVARDPQDIAKVFIDAMLAR